MKIIFALILVLSSQYALADDIGRYQAVNIPKDSSGVNADSVFIIDTKEGHIWLWTQFPLIKDVSEGGRYLVYQGKVKPGKKMGDIIEQRSYK